MIDLGQRRDGALAAAAARALLDRDGRRNAVDGVDVGAAGGLDELARVRVQRLEIAALAFGEQDVERDGALAAAADAGDHGELVARDREIDVPQVVLARVPRSRIALLRRRRVDAREASGRVIAVAAATPVAAALASARGSAMRSQRPAVSALQRALRMTRARAVWPMAAARTAAGGPSRRWRRRRRRLRGRDR